MKLTHKSVELELKVDAENRRIAGYGSVFGNLDSSGDIILPGAFTDSLKRRMPAMLYQHWSEKLIGMYDVAREDAKGLYLEGPLAKTDLADEAYELARMGALKGMSIGYSPMKFEYDETGVRILKEVDLWEVSLVTFPANNQATITGVKSLEGVSFEELFDHKNEIEAALRDAGASNKAAKYVASLLRPPAQRDVVGAELSATITKAINILKG